MKQNFIDYLKKNIYFFGQNSQLEFIYIDDNYNFYALEEDWVSIYSFGSFCQGLYNYLKRDYNNDFFLRYDTLMDSEDFIHNKNNDVLWRKMYDTKGNEDFWVPLDIDEIKNYDDFLVEKNKKFII